MFSELHSSNINIACRGSPMHIEPPKTRPNIRNISTPYGISRSIDTLVCVDTKSLYTSWRLTEDRFRSYTPNAKFLKWRRVLVDWLCDAGSEFDLHSSTMHVAAMYMDRVLQVAKVPRSDLQLVAMVCCLIAIKFEEAENKLPSFYEISSYAGGKYVDSDIQSMEAWVLSILKWNLSCVVPSKYLQYYIAKGAVFECDTIQGRPLIEKVPKYVSKYTDFFADLCLQEYSFQQYPSSLLAAAILGASRRALHIQPLWRPELEQLTTFSESEIWTCYEHIWRYYVDSFPEEARKRYDGDNYEISPNSIQF